jgi:hypothetical protein
VTAGYLRLAKASCLQQYSAAQLGTSVQAERYSVIDHYWTAPPSILASMKYTVDLRCRSLIPLRRNLSYVEPSDELAFDTVALKRIWC